MVVIVDEARAPDKEKIKADYLKGIKPKELSEKYNISINTVKSWIKRYGWSKDVKEEGAPRNKKGAPLNNKNSVGHKPSIPEGNKNSEKHGFFAKWLPEETMQIMKEIEKIDPLDILGDNIQLQYTAIVRAQKLMYVKDQQDITTTKIGEGFSDTGSSEKWEVQQAWDKHATFLKAQSRAMAELRSMIKQYDEMLHKNWDDATEEQKARIALLKAKVNMDGEDQTEDDGFLEALTGKVDEIWQEE